MTSTIGIVKKSFLDTQKEESLIPERDPIADDLFEPMKQLKTEFIEELEKAACSFLKSYMDSRLFIHHQFFGIPIVKNPFDLMLFQEMIYRLRPDNIIETGGGFAGSAFFYALLMDVLGLKGKVITLEQLKYPLSYINEAWRNCTHISQKLAYYQGACSIDSMCLDEIFNEIGGDRNLVFLDSDHQKNYVLVEMMCFDRFVQPGMYMVVEDTCLSGHPARDKYNEKWVGPWEAVETFLTLPGQSERWIQDRSCERYFFTNNKNGYLRKIKS